MASPSYIKNFPVKQSPKHSDYYANTLAFDVGSAGSAADRADLTPKKERLA